MEGLQADVFRCHGDVTEKKTARTGQTRTSALQVRSDGLEKRRTGMTFE